MDLVKWLMACCLFLNSCSFRENVFGRKLYSDPVESHIKRFERVLGNVDKGIKESRGRIEQAKWKLYDVVDGCRGDGLAEKLNEQLEDIKLSEKDLLVAFVGATHTNAFYLKLEDKFNVYFFSEVPYADSKEIFLKESPFLLAQFTRRAGKQNLKRKKPTAIVYGDDHSIDFDFSNYFPSVLELRKQGIERMILACERLKPNCVMSLGFLSEYAEIKGSPNYRSMIRYLADAENSGIKVEVLGIETDIYL